MKLTAVCDVGVGMAIWCAGKLWRGRMVNDTIANVVPEEWLKWIIMASVSFDKMD